MRVRDLRAGDCARLATGGGRFVVTGEPRLQDVPVLYESGWVGSLHGRQLRLEVELIGRGSYTSTTTKTIVWPDGTETVHRWTETAP